MLNKIKNFFINYDNVNLKEELNKFNLLENKEELILEHENIIDETLNFLDLNYLDIINDKIIENMIQFLFEISKTKYFKDNNKFYKLFEKYNNNNFFCNIKDEDILLKLIYLYLIFIKERNLNLYKNKKFIKFLLGNLNIKNTFELKHIILKLLYNLFVILDKKEKSILCNILNDYNQFYFDLIIFIEENINYREINLLILFELLSYNKIKKLIWDRIFYCLLLLIKKEKNDNLNIFCSKLILVLIKNEFCNFHSKKLLLKNIIKIIPLEKNLNKITIILLVILKLIIDVHLNFLFYYEINLIIFKLIIKLKNNFNDESWNEFLENTNNNLYKVLIYSFNIIRINFTIQKAKKNIKILIQNDLMDDFSNLSIEIKNYKDYENFVDLFLKLNKESFEIMINNYNDIFLKENQIIKQLLNYSFYEIIGFGSFGNIYLCYKNKDKKTLYAIKEIKLDDKDKDSYNKSLKEKEILSELNHNNIVKYKGSFYKDNHIYIVMEYIFGMNLVEYINCYKERNLIIPSKIIIEIIVQLLIILKYLKEKSIIHRDISNSNLILDFKTNYLKLIDFGLAFHKKTGINDINNSKLELDKENKFIGNIVYSSPEMIKNKILNLKNDLWSFNVIVYQLISENYDLPFFSENIFTVVKLIEKINFNPLNVNKIYEKEIKNFIEICDKIIKKNFIEDIKKRMNLDTIIKEYFIFILDLTEKYQNINYNLLYDSSNLNELNFSKKMFKIYKNIYFNFKENQNTIININENNEFFFKVLNNIRLKKYNNNNKDN